MKCGSVKFFCKVQMSFNNLYEFSLSMYVYVTIVIDLVASLLGLKCVTH